MSTTYDNAYTSTDGLSEKIDNTGAAVATEIAVLRKRIEALMTERVTPAIADAAGQAQAAAREASDAVRRQADRVAGKVREEPLAALCVAAAAGFLIARIMRR